MTARRIMSPGEIEQDPARWKTERLKGISASQVAAMLGLCNPEYGSPFELYTEKVNGQEMQGDSDAMARGRYLEPYVVERFGDWSAESLQVCEGGLYASADRPWELATFDRLAVDLDRLGLREATAAVDPEVIYPVQVKTSVFSPRYQNPGPDDWGEPGTSQIPMPYRAQCLAEMDVAEAEMVIIPVLFMVSWKLEVYFLNRDAAAENDIKLIRAEGERFMNRVADRDPPPVDWTPATARALRTVFPDTGKTARIPRKLAEKYKRAKAAQEQAKHRAGLAVNEIMASTEGATVITTMVGGEEVVVAKRRVFPRKSTDTKALKKHYPDIAKEVEKTSTVDALWAGPWAKGETGE